MMCSSGECGRFYDMSTSRTHQVPATEVDRLMKAKASILTPGLRTLRNAIRGAKRNEVTYFVGSTYTRFHIVTDPSGLGAGVQYEVTPDGAVYGVAA